MAAGCFDPQTAAPRQAPTIAAGPQEQWSFNLVVRTKLRARLRAVPDIPAWFSYPEVVNFHEAADDQRH